MNRPEERNKRLSNSFMWGAEHIFSISANFSGTGAYIFALVLVESGVEGVARPLLGSRFLSLGGRGHSVAV
jgi:hypothetical protein